MSSIFGDKPVVGIIMGSESDMPTMEACMKQLEELDVPYEVKVASAHPQARRGTRMGIFCSRPRYSRYHRCCWQGCSPRRVLVAAYTPLPVIAVPMKTSDLGGLDSLLSMVQMPSGVPVATVAINGAKNAGILAVQMLGTGNDEASR